LIQLDSNNIKLHSQSQSNELNFEISNDSSNSHESFLVSVKLQTLQKYYNPLLILINKCEQQLNTIHISDEKKKYFKDSLSKLQIIRSVLEGNDFIVPNGSTQFDVLLKIEEQLTSIVKRIDVTSCELKQGDSNNNNSNSNTIVTCNNFDLFCNTLNIQEFKNIFQQNHIRSIDDIRLLSLDDMKELGIPIGIRNKIISHFNKMNDK